MTKRKTWRRAAGFALSLALLCGALTGCAGIQSLWKNALSQNQTDESTEPVPEYEKGTRTDKTYTSAWMGLQYILPEDMIMLTDEQIQQAMQIGTESLTVDEKTGQKILDDSKLSVSYEMAAGSVNGESIVLITEKMVIALSEEQYLKAGKSQLQQSMSADIEFGDVTKRTVAGMEFTELTYKLQAGDEAGTSMQQTLLCRRMGERMINMTLSYSDEAGLDYLLAGFSPLS